MSWFKSTGFHSQLTPTQSAEEPVAAQPLNEMQPPQPREAPMAKRDPLAEPHADEAPRLGVPLGTLIFRAGLLTDEQLEDALHEGVRSGRRLGEVLLEDGLVDERDLGRLLADQKGLPFVELSQLTLDPAATALLSAEQAHMFSALPVGFEHGVPVVAVSDPSNEVVTENLRRALGIELRLVVASRSDLYATIEGTQGTAVAGPTVKEPVADEPEPQAEVPPFMTGLAFAPAALPTPRPAIEPTTEPALRPVEVAHVASPVPETPVAKPVAAAAAEPMLDRVEESEPQAEAERDEELLSGLSYDVSLRLSDGERVPVGSFSDSQEAREYGREVVRHLSDETDGWPYFSGRFMRPDTILSVDIVVVGAPERSLGSSVRANWASRLNR